MVHVHYTVAAERQAAFLDAMIAVRLSRLRTGATDWELLRAIDSPGAFTESFTVPTWEEHVRQQTERTTGTALAKTARLAQQGNGEWKNVSPEDLERLLD